MPSPNVAGRELLVRRMFMRAVALFLVLFTTNVLIFGWLLFHDFDRRTISDKLKEAADTGTVLANNLSREMAPAGGFDFVRIIERRFALGQIIDQYTAQLKFVKFLDIRDRTGRLVFRKIVGEPGHWQIHTGGAFGGEAPPSPDSPPPLPGLSDGQQFLLPASASVRQVQVPLGTTGTLNLGVISGPLEQEVARLRRTLVVELVFGGVISLVLLAVAFLYVLRLVHKTRRLEADAQRAEQLAYLGTLASGLAHEIRNPLNAMNINLQMLEEELDEAKLSEEPLDLLRSSRSEVLRLERLVKDFLAYARPQSTRRQEIAPAGLVADVIRFVRPAFQEAGVKLELLQEPGAPIVRVDPEQIRQALLNILQNALEASPREGTVTVSVGATPRGEARIAIRDEGAGIAEDARARIFEVFWSKKPAGSGLGLPIAQRVVEGHGGRIELDSETGKGSTFRIVLPSAFVAEAQPQAAPGTAAPGVN